ncbi:MAG: hypothetical protein RMI94_07175 [Bryobacterales bacterium]|nr:hypothetical protein [Bryobacteraceae bacterium]MDW8130314.1 hypothetical protein [Bryobacterales bacterium]
MERITAPPRKVDLFLASTIAYGSLGWLVTGWGLDDPFGVAVMASSCYMIQQLQQQYASVRPRRIEYAGPRDRMLEPSQAHSTGAMAGGRIHVEYENGTHVWVNRASEGTWTVRGEDGASFRLPPPGWLAWNKAGGFLEFSAELVGRRVDYVRAPGYEFLDGRGQSTEYGRLGARRSVARRDRAGQRPHPHHGFLTSAATARRRGGGWASFLRM